MPGVAGAVDMVEAPNGRQLYVAAAEGDRLAVLERRDDGSLAKPRGRTGCVAQASGGPHCAAVRALRGPRAVGVSPDGANVYVASTQSDAVAVFERDRATGELEQPSGRAGCVIQAGAAAARKGACSTASPISRLAPTAGTSTPCPRRSMRSLLSRSARKGLRRLPRSRGCFIRGGVLGCSEGRALTRGAGITVSPDGRNTYVASESPDLGGIAVFRRSRR